MSLRETLTWRRPVAGGRPMAAGAGTIAASESVTVGFDLRITGIRDVDADRRIVAFAKQHAATEIYSYDSDMQKNPSASGMEVLSV